MALPWLSTFFLKVLSLYSILTLFSTQIPRLRSHKHNDPWRCHGTLLRHPSFEFIVFNPSFELMMFNLIFHTLTVAPSSEPKGPCPRKLGKGPFWHWTGLPLWLLVPGTLFYLSFSISCHGAVFNPSLQIVFNVGFVSLCSIFYFWVICLWRCHRVYVIFPDMSLNSPCSVWVVMLQSPKF